MKKPVICLMGPTACGKTNAAIELVQRFPLEIVSVDSVMIYRDLNIGSAKPSAEELAIAPHRLIDIQDPSIPYSAGQFCEDALKAINDIHNNNKIPLLVGGTFLYFHLLQRGFSDLPPADQNVREQIALDAQQKGWPALHKELSIIDPEAAKKIKPNDQQRIQRAIELMTLTRQTVSALQATQNLRPPPYEFINIAIAMNNRPALHQRIAMRFEKMLNDGLVDEVRTLFARDDLHANLPSIRSVGYRQVWAFLSNEYDYDTMKERGIIATRQLAKRQFTWLNRYKHATRFESSDPQAISAIIDYMSQYC